MRAPRAGCLDLGMLVARLDGAEGEDRVCGVRMGRVVRVCEPVVGVQSNWDEIVRWAHPVR